MLGEDRVQESLECCQRIRQPKWHDSEVEVFVMRLERHFHLINMLHQDLIVTDMEVELREVGRATSSLSSSTIGKRNLFFIVMSGVDSPHKRPRSILLREEHGSGIWAHVVHDHPATHISLTRRSILPFCK